MHREEKKETFVMADEPDGAVVKTSLLIPSAQRPRRIVTIALGRGSPKRGTSEGTPSIPDGEIGTGKVILKS
jgi:hypothetical protein